MTRRLRVTTTTTLVLELLTREHDLLTQQQLRERLPQCNANQVSAALCHLVKRKAVGFLADDVTTLYYATPETDDRTKTVDERTPESKPRKRRITKK